MLKFLTFSLLGTLFNGVVWAQSRGVFIPLNAEYYHLIERYEIRSGQFGSGFHGQVKPYRRRDVVQLAERVEVDPALPRSEADRFNLQYLQNDSWEWAIDTLAATSRRPLLKTFYRKKADFFSTRNDDFEVHLNPVFYGSTGLGDDVPNGGYVNTRGIEVRGSVGKKLGFYSYLADNQLRMPGYFTDRVKATNALPNEGFYKTYRGDSSTYDFYTVRGYVTFDPLRQLNVQFGHDKVFIGTGLRSVILSDFSSPFLFLKATTQLGPVQYQNLFAEIINNQIPGLPYGELAPKKFLAFHHLSVNIGKHVNVGVFEAVVHSRGKDQGYFDLRYLNPVIFYRAIEGEKNSPDNVLLGLDFRANILRRFSLYGQLMLDEFKFDEAFNGKGWWGNKVAAQAGLKYIDVLGIRNLDLQGEFNLARPYTYQHLSDRTNYVAYNQPLAHPLGANFVEFTGVARYQPLPRLNLTATYVAAQSGANRNGQNWGNNPLEPYTTRILDYGNRITQGQKTNLTLLDAVVSYQVKHNVFVDVRHLRRFQDATGDRFDRNTVFTSVALRINIAQRGLAF
ncbi:MAG: hypothetical protein H7Y12_03305 [Sphingobacteriaceae bacterium]|nr:hypothetical protein [Cytophagaceae bacterium]